MEENTKEIFEAATVEEVVATEDNGNKKFTVNTIQEKKFGLKRTFFRGIVCVIFTLLVIVPFYILIVNATHKTADIMSGIKLLPGADFFKNFAKVLEGTGSTSTISFGKALFNSLLVTIPTTILQIYFGSLTAYGIVVYNFKYKKRIWAFIYGIMMIPTQVTIVGLIKVCNLTHLYGTLWPLILPAIATPTTVYFMKQYMESSLSVDIIESARMDGAKELYIFNKIVLPILKPAMATQAILAFVTSWNNLYTPSILLATETSTKGTMPMFIEALKSNDKEQDFGQIYCALLITVLPIMIVYLFLSKYIVEGVSLGGVKE